MAVAEVPERVEREILSPEELADYLGIARSTAYELLRTGEIRSFKLGRLRRIRRRDVEQFVEKLASDPDAA